MKFLKEIAVVLGSAVALIALISLLNNQFLAIRQISPELNIDTAALATKQTPPTQVTLRPTRVSRTQTPTPKAKSTRTPTPPATLAKASPTPVVINVAKLHQTNLRRVDDLLQCDLRVAVSPNRKSFVCGNVKNGKGVWLGTFKKGLTKQLAEKPGYVRWFPDGQRIAYSVGVPSGQMSTLFDIDLASGKLTEIGQTSNASHFQVDDAGSVLFLAKNGPMIRNSNNGQTKPITNPGSQLGSLMESEFSGDPAAADSSFLLSPDGQHLAIQSVWYEKGTLTLVDLNASTIVTVTEQMGNGALPMTWTSDSSRLYYATQDENATGSALWFVNADGVNPQQIWQTTACVNLQYVKLMADGQTPIFVCTKGGNSFEVDWHYMALDPTTGMLNDLFTNGEGLDLVNDGFDILVLRSVEDIGDWIIEISQ